MQGTRGRPRRTELRGRTFHWGERTYVMGVINVTPDSFSRDGVMDVEAAVAQGKGFVAQGADILDVGGESTRPAFAARLERRLTGRDSFEGARHVSEAEELRRVIPVIQRLAQEVEVPISVDTYKSGVARRAVEAGASIINDVWGLKRDPGIAPVAAKYGCGLILMHNQEGTTYQELIPDILGGLRDSVDAARKAGVAADKIILDPGIGFGKTAEQNLEVLRRLRAFRRLGRPLLVGTSRKSTIGLVVGVPVEDRLEGTAATVALAIANGADIVRVHDVQQMARVARMSDAIVRGWTQPRGVSL